MPLYLFAFHVGATRPALTSVRMSGSSEKSTTSAGSPLTIACAWSAEGPYDCVNETSLPAGVCWKAGMILENASFGVEYATSDSVVSVVRAPAAGTTNAASRAVSRAMRRTSLLCRSVWSGMKQANEPNNDLSKEVQPVDLGQRPCERRRVNALYGRGDWWRALTRLLGVVGVLLLVLTWRLDEAVRTAYVSGWTGLTIKLDDCATCRLPGDWWTRVHGVGALVAVVLFVIALSVWLWRKPGDAPVHLKWICGVTSGAAVVLECVAWHLRRQTDMDHGLGSLGPARACDLAALALLGVFFAAIVGSYGGDNLHAARRFIQRHGLSLVGVVAFALITDVVGQTSGQAIDSVRGWMVWSDQGMSRLAFGLATTILLSLVVYESGLRLDQIRFPDSLKPIEIKFWLGFGIPLLVAGIILAKIVHLGWGIAVLGALLCLLGLLELPELSVDDPPPPEMAVAAESYSSAASEYLAIVPIIAISAIALAGAVDAALSDATHIRARSLLVLFPCVLLAAVAVVMTTNDVTPKLPRLGLWHGVVALVGVGAVALIVWFVDSEGFAAAAGFFLLALMLLYAWILFHGSAEIVSDGRILLCIPIAIWTGVAVALSVHGNVFGVTDTLGVFGLVNVALAFLLASLNYVVARGLHFRPPKFLWYLHMQQLPIVLLLVVWWIAAGLISPPKTLHDARVVEAAPHASPHSISGAFAAWRRSQGTTWTRGTRKDPPLPLVVVASHGGGIRAAYWTALALDCVVGGASVSALPDADYKDTCTRGRRPPDDQLAAARRIFLASAVSGGAVGLYAYAREFLSVGALHDGWVDQRLFGDFASPPVGWALFHDLPNHLIGINPRTGGRCDRRHMGDQCFAQDRAAVLEDAFDRKWDAPVPYLRATWAQRFSGSRDQRRRAQAVPIIVDNSTVVGGQTRAVTSPIVLSSWPNGESSEVSATSAVDEHPLAGTAQVLAALCTRNDIRLSTAALLASRFPYVNPSGRLNADCEPHPWKGESSLCAEKEIDCRMALVDGGYTDNSGLFTIEAILPTLRRLIEESNAEFKDRPRIALVLVEIDNHYRAAVSEPPSATSNAAETFVPLVTSLGGRSAMETFARAIAYRLLPPRCALTISPALHPGLSAPLGWELSAGARDDLQAGLVRDGDKKRQEQPIVLVRRLQQWLGGALNGEAVSLRKCVPLDPPFGTTH